MFSSVSTVEVCSHAPVLVTGGNGFIAGHIISQLLGKGYKVRTTVRELENRKTYEHLLKLDNAESNLEILEADLLDSESWNKVFEGGIEYVFHVAAPYTMKPQDPEAALMVPTVGGTKIILEYCQNTESVKKLIYTSCIQTLCNEFDDSIEYDETSWNETASMARNSYAYSKTTAEREAWAFVSRPDCTFKMVSIVAGVTLGPHVGASLSTSHNFLLAFLEGRVKGIMNLNLNIADVRDIATAHLICMENPASEGRYCCCNKATSVTEILQVVHENFPDLYVPTRKFRDPVVRMYCMAEGSGRSEYCLLNLSRTPRIRCARAKAIGIVFRPPVQTIVDTCRYLIENNLISSPASGGCALM